MSKQLQSDKTVDLKKVRLQNNFQQLSARWGDTNDVFFRLCRRLQLTLEPAEMLDMFTEELNSLISFDSLNYEFSEGKEDFVYSVGYGGSHRCEYSLNLEGMLLGQLSLTRRQRFIEQELIVLEQLSSILAVSLRNAWRFNEAQMAAMTDSITHLGNRRLMDRELERELCRARRHDTTFSAILCDLDHFKQVNDTYGHLNGDRILAKIAQLMQESVRNSDACFRYGGEELAVLLPNTSIDDACVVAERIRVAIERSPLNTPEGDIFVTISAGVSTFVAEDTAASLLQRADSALYLAKRQGRNCVFSDKASLDLTKPLV